MRTPILPGPVRALRPAPALAALVALALAAGCGYRAGSLVTSDVRTVHVPVFENATFRRGLEFQLTEAVLREVRRRTHLRIAEADEADTVLTGEVVDFRGRVETRDVEDEVFTQDVRVYVNVRWVDRRTGRVLAEASRLNRPVRVYATRGDTVPTATAESFRFLAEDIVDLMEGGW